MYAKLYAAQKRFDLTKVQNTAKITKACINTAGNCRRVIK